MNAVAETKRAMQNSRKSGERNATHPCAGSIEAGVAAADAGAAAAAVLGGILFFVPTAEGGAPPQPHLGRNRARSRLAGGGEQWAEQQAHNIASPLLRRRYTPMHFTPGKSLARCKRSMIGYAGVDQRLRTRTDEIKRQRGTSRLGPRTGVRLTTSDWRTESRPWPLEDDDQIVGLKSFEGFYRYERRSSKFRSRTEKIEFAMKRINRFFCPAENSLQVRHIIFTGVDGYVFFGENSPNFL